MIGICTSTGGPGVLEELLGALPADFSVPILVAQHMSTGFIVGLVKLLDTRVSLPVAVARDGADLRPGALFAPDGAHLTVDGKMRIVLDRTTVAGPHRPSCDLLLGSIAAAAGRHAVGVVLTGMGSDGARGGAALQAAGGLQLAQDPDAAAAYGMPRSAVRAGAEPMSIDGLAATLRELGG